MKFNFNLKGRQPADTRYAFIKAEAPDVQSDLLKMLLDGDPSAHFTYQKLLHLQDNDPVYFVRDECRRAANSIDAGGALGLRHELRRLHKLRRTLREAALKKLTLEGGAS